jgi:DNA repair exonuclease SbcCD ATPase subunit
MSDALDTYKVELTKTEDEKAEIQTVYDEIVAKINKLDFEINELETLSLRGKLSKKNNSKLTTARSELKTLNASEKNYKNELSQISSKIKQETNRINALDADITSLLDSRDQLRLNLGQVKTEIEGMDGFVEDFSQIASDPSIRIPPNIADRMTPAQIPIRADGGVGEEKEDDITSLLSQTSQNVVKPESDKLRAYENYIIQFKPKKFNYPRRKDDFIGEVDMKQMKVLLSLLGLNISVSSIPNSPLITVGTLYDHFLSSNQKLMTTTKIPQYYFS